MNKLMAVGAAAVLAACGGQVSEKTQQKASVQASILLDGSNAIGPAPLLEYLDATRSVCTNGCSAYEWDFGDGTPAGHDGWMTHVYDRAGAYTVRLTAIDSTTGATGTATVKIVAGD